MLAWIAGNPRTYAETIEVWRPNCPRDPAWEDALIAGFVEVRDGRKVMLTARGRAVLDGG